MVYDPRSSFSQQPISSGIPVQVTKRKRIRVFNFISTLLLFAAIIAVVGCFLYKDYLVRQITSLQDNLSKTSLQNNEVVKKIDELRSYNNRLVFGAGLIANHKAPSLLFKKLEEITKETVQFDTFTYSYDPGYKAELELTGGSENFASVFLQKNQFLSDEIFDKFYVNDINASIDGEDDSEKTEVFDSGKSKVGFSVKGILRDDVLLFDKAIEFQKQQVSVQSTQVSDVSSNASSSNSIEI